MESGRIELGRARPFRQRLLGGEFLLGSFVKTPSPAVVEILGDVGLDFVVIDEEHASFDRESTDLAILAARATGMPALVRVPSASPWHLLAVLDAGAAGVLVPHVMTAAQARDIVAGCRYRNGRRGFSASSRAGRYGGLGRWEHVEQADGNTAVVAQIEDPDALAEVEAIAAVDGIDALFIGRGDLSVAMGAESAEAEPVRVASERIAAAARAAGKPVFVFAATAREAEWLKGLGATAFISSSDQGLLRRAAAAAVKEFAELVPRTPSLA
jgi:2-keto-3-deoxy-L-rhamnonate aldolase RhmA